jgi:hypothetical protein
MKKRLFFRFQNLIIILSRAIVPSCERGEAVAGTSAPMASYPGVTTTLVTAELIGKLNGDRVSLASPPDRRPPPPLS